MEYPENQEPFEDENAESSPEESAPLEPVGADEVKDAPEVSPEEQAAIDETTELVELKEVQKALLSESQAALFPLVQALREGGKDLLDNSELALNESRKNVIKATASLADSSKQIDAAPPEAGPSELLKRFEQRKHLRFKPLKLANAAALFLIGAIIATMIQAGLLSQNQSDFDINKFTAFSFSPRLNEDKWVTLSPDQSWRYADDFAFLTGDQLWPQAPMIKTAAQPVSSFPYRTETAAYEHLKQIIGSGRLPVLRDIRIEDYLNHFRYKFSKPLSFSLGKDTEAKGELQFHVTECPWDEKLHLLFIKTSIVPEISKGPAAIQDLALRIAWNPRYVYGHRLIGYENALQASSEHLKAPIRLGDLREKYEMLTVFQVNMQSFKEDKLNSPFLATKGWTEQTNEKIIGSIQFADNVIDLPLPVQLEPAQDATFAAIVTEYGLRLRRALPLTREALGELMDRMETSLDELEATKEALAETLGKTPEHADKGATKGATGITDTLAPLEDEIQKRIEFLRVIENTRINLEYRPKR